MTDTAWLNEDFKSSKSALTLSLKNLGPGEDLPTGTVLQIQSVVNVSLPLKSLVESKVEYDGKRHMLKLCLTDGKETIYGLLYEPHPKLSNNTVPGTKVKTLRPIPIVSRILRFTRGNIELLGGYVEPMVENWKVQREHEKRSSWGKSITGSGEDGAPKWKSLDARGPSGSGVGNIRELRNAKAMDILEEVKNKGQGKEESKTEFDAQRKEAILDLVKQQPTKKTFAVAKNIPLTISEPSVPKREPREGPREPKSRDKKFRDRDPDEERLSREDKELASKYQYHGGQLSLKDHFSSFFGKPQAETEADPDSDIEKAIQLSLKDMNQLNIGSNDHYSSDRQSYQDCGRGNRGDRDHRGGRSDRGDRDDRGGRSDRGGGRGDRRGGRGDRGGGRGDRRGGRGDRGGRGYGRGNSSYSDSRESPFQSDFRESSSSGGGPRGQNHNPSREQYSSGQADYGEFRSNGRGSYSAGPGRGGSYEDSRGSGRGGRGRDRGSFSGREDYSSRNREDYGQSNYSRDQFGGPTPYRGGKVAYSANTGYHNENGRLDSSQNQSAPPQRTQEYYSEEWPSVGEPMDSANFQAAPTQSAGSYDFKLGQNLVFNRSDRRKPDDVRDNRRYDGIWEGDIRGRGRSRGPSSRGRSSFEQPRSNYGGY